MKAKHTPGPWTLHPTALHPAVRSVGTPDAGPRRICTVGTMNGNPVDKANARLIAAAPEMLDALIALLIVAPSKAPGAGLIVGAEEKHANALQAARAAIKKATGDA